LLKWLVSELPYTASAKSTMQAIDQRESLLRGVKL
jgi:hypothetical protein